MPPTLKTLLITLTTITLTYCQYLIFNPQSQLSKSLATSRIKVKSSPIGFKPKIGSLHGKLILANPLSACTQISQELFGGNQDIFVLVDDIGCMESIKAKNIAGSGAYIGIIKRNINNTLNDKQIDIVHIPILQIQPNNFNTITQYILNNPQQPISVLADFNPQSQSPTKKVKLQLWLSPNQVQAYNFINQFGTFLSEQSDLIQFHPRFVLHSQGKNVQYIGCLSSGRFCPPELQFQGKPQGAKIVKESLRQIIIAQKNINNWFEYALLYNAQCLKKFRQDLWRQQNSQICSENIMLNTKIDPYEIYKQYNKSFTGPRPEVDTNTYLQQQRQLFIQQKITKIPIILLNNKPYSIQQNPRTIKIKICSMLNPNPDLQSPQCQKITNPSLFSYGELMIIAACLINLLVCLMVGCRLVIKKRMTLEIRGQVDNTLQQYYRYMQTFEQPNPHQSPIKNIKNQQEVELQQYN